MTATGQPFLLLILPVHKVILDQPSCICQIPELLFLHKLLTVKTFSMTYNADLGLVPPWVNVILFPQIATN